MEPNCVDNSVLATDAAAKTKIAVKYIIFLSYYCIELKSMRNDSIQYRLLY
jgi:hypothetical protein